MSKPYAAIVGGAAAVAIIAVFIILWFCRTHCRNLSHTNSETGSSDSSAQVEYNRGHRSSSAPTCPLFGPEGARQFTMDELERATKKFTESSLIGYGSFGSVYKGLLQDTVVAIKRRTSAPREEFVMEVIYLSEIRQRNLVSLLGYCQERGAQMLVFEYVPNGSMCNHLYDMKLESSNILEFKQRLSIALGAAKGLCHLHSLNPPLMHKNFKTANVLVDENFIVKVSDAGISKLLEKIEEAGPSYKSNANVFQDPETGVSGTFTEMSDVYSFGVFLMELITGQEATELGFVGVQGSLIHWVASRLNSNNFVDQRLMGNFTTDGIRDLIRLTLRCMGFPGKERPKMQMVVVELERIHEKEMAVTTFMGEKAVSYLLYKETNKTIYVSLCLGQA